MLRGFPTGIVASIVLSSCGAPAPTFSGTVQTESVAVGSQVGGRIAEVDATTGSRVRRGDVVLRLDPALLQAQEDQSAAQARQAAERLAEVEHGSVASDVARAREQSAQAAAQYAETVARIAPQSSAQSAAVREAQSSVRDASAGMRDAQAAVRLAQSTFQRTQALAATGDVSHQSLDQTRAEYAQAQARLTQARARYAQAQARLSQARSNYSAVVNAQLPGEQAGARANAAAQRANYETVRSGARAEEIAQAKAQLEAAQAAANYARVRLAESIVRAPADGIVESLNLHSGDLLGPNQQAAIIDTFVDPYVYIYASQRDLASLAQSAHVRVISDAGGAEYDGVVEAHDRTAQFTPQNTETADQRAELVYGVKVRVHDPQHRLLDGTTVTVRLR